MLRLSNFFRHIRFKRPILLGLLLLLLIIPIVASEQESFLPLPPSGQKWQLAFADEFNNQTRLDSSKWVTCYDWYNEVYGGCTNPGNKELQWYQSSQVWVGDGRATLTAKQAPAMGLSMSSVQVFPYQSGMISTGRPSFNAPPKFPVKYGYITANIKIEGGKGLWPSFWLFPLDHNWPPEIDIMEFFGDRANSIYMTHHWQDDEGNAQKDWSIYQGPDMTDGWHRYAINWQPGSIDWYIDGVLRKSVRGSNVSSEPMELIINLAVGGNVGSSGLPGNPDAFTTFPTRMHIDYVRIYKSVPKP